MEKSFEERLADLINECLPGEGREAIISGLEIQLMAQREAEGVAEAEAVKR